MPSSFASLLLRRCPAVGSLILLRRMGGGPRTFPGGLSKWKYRRMHEKLAREKERRLLNQEKDLYLARLRSELRARAAFGDAALGDPSSGGCWMSSGEHVKALADRFVKDGAEDLWNDDDGPAHPVRPQVPHAKRVANTEGTNSFLDETDRNAWKQIESFYQCKDEASNRQHLVLPHPSLQTTPSSSGYQSPYPKVLELGLRSFTDDGCKTLWQKTGSFHQRREYSVHTGRGHKASSKYEYKKKWDSDSESEYSYGMNIMHQGNARLDRVLFGNEVLGKELDEPKLAGGKSSKSKIRNGAVLGAKGHKDTRSAHSHELEKISLLQEVHYIREELEKRRALGEVERNKVVEKLVLSEKRFDEYAISPSTIKVLTSAGHVFMTATQESLIPIILNGKDALVKAKAGVEKIASYLIPTIETVHKALTSSRNKRVPPILALFICPTRELASQVAAEANFLMKYHVGIGAQTLVGGSRLKLDEKCLESNHSQIIVATPGRLQDHIENKSGFSARLMGLKVLVIDEADHLLDLGFRSDLAKIMDHVPRLRQTLIFSSVVTKEVRRISQLVLKKDCDFVDATGLGGQGTNVKVMQTCTVASNDKHFEIVYHLLKEHIEQKVEHKVVIFCTTDNMVEVMCAFLRYMKMNVRELHSRKPLLYRTRICDEFRNAKHLVLVMSDALALDINYPDVTLLLQVGVPSDFEKYISCLEAVESEGKHGKCILLIAPFEEDFVEELMDNVGRFQAPTLDSNLQSQVEAAMQKVSTRSKEAAYHAWLRFYSSIPDFGVDKTMLANSAIKFCSSLGLEKPPPLLRRTAIKLGLENMPGIVIKK